MFYKPTSPSFTYRCIDGTWHTLRHKLTFYNRNEKTTLWPSLIWTAVTNVKSLKAFSAALKRSNKKQQHSPGRATFVYDTRQSNHPHVNSDFPSRHLTQRNKECAFTSWNPLTKPSLAARAHYRNAYHRAKKNDLVTRQVIYLIVNDTANV